MPLSAFRSSAETLPGRTGGRYATRAGVVTLVYAAAFGLPAPWVGDFLQREGRLPSFFGLFDMYGGPWSDTMPPDAFRDRLYAFLGMTGLVAGTGWLLLRRSRTGGVLNLALLPVEAVFWTGFALPIPWLVGAARVGLVALAWRELGHPDLEGAVGSQVSGIRPDPRGGNTT